MDWIEEEGRTMDKALGKALKKMGVTRKEVDMEVLEENKGILAYLGDRTVRVRVSLIKNEIGRAEPETTSEGHYSVQENDINAGRKYPEEAKKVLGDILTRMDIPCVIEGTSNDNEISLNIFSDKGGLIIGKRGETIDALQHIVSKAINKGGQERLKVFLDAENYRERRRERIKNLAENLAAKVKETSKPATLEEMNSQDRKIIHMTLQGDSQIQTESRGDGMFKKVIISFKEKNSF